MTKQVLYITPFSITIKNIPNSIKLIEFLKRNMKLLLLGEKTNLNEIQFETNSIIPQQQFSLKSDLIIYTSCLVHNYATCN